MKTVVAGPVFVKIPDGGEVLMKAIANHVERFGVQCVQVRVLDRTGFNGNDAEAAGHFGLLGEPKRIGTCLADLVSELHARAEAIADPDELAALLARRDGCNQGGQHNEIAEH
ncbi:MAG: hypothetical protein QM473_15260 [Acidobacteriota bacterium]|jgi:hypothetical protein|nr:hypothetical protein [Acidobacteriota bacterium]